MVARVNERGRALQGPLVPLILVDGGPASESGPVSINMLNCPIGRSWDSEGHASYEIIDESWPPRRRPTLLNGTVPPPRRRNRDVRPREYLTPKEVERFIAAAKRSGRRYGLRDATMILVAFRHGLRVSELCALTWDQIDFSHGMIHVRRFKNGIPSVQQIGGEEMRPSEPSGAKMARVVSSS